MLRSSKDKPIATQIAHLIIDPVLKALYASILKRDNAMQVQLLNLLKVILFECQFAKDMESCRKILSTSKTFKDILTQGLLNPVAYVRQHFIEFVVYLVPMMKRLLEEVEIKDTISDIIVCMVKILRQVDLRMYGEKVEEHH